MPVVLISGNFRPDDHWHAQVIHRNRQCEYFPPCPDCGEELREREPVERVCGLPEISSDFGLPEVGRACGSLFTLVSSVLVPEDEEAPDWLLRRRYGYGELRDW